MSVTHVKQSAIVPVRCDAFWGILQKMDFTWWNHVASAACTDGNASAVGSIHTLTFKDGASWTIRVSGISGGSSKFIEFELLASEPAGACASSMHTLSVEEITFSQETLFTWTADYSSDVSVEIIEDSKFKRRECFAHLVAHSHTGNFGPVPNAARAAMAAHLAAEEAQHPHLNHVVPGQGVDAAAGGGATAGKK